jgi:hypothetical protein
MTFGNIKSAEFKDTWPSGRKFKHGAMLFKFKFRPATFTGAADEIEVFMKERGYDRGVHYHIPAWNLRSKYSIGDAVKEEVYITFNDDETFVMAKLSWDFGDGESI